MSNLDQQHTTETIGAYDSLIEMLHAIASEVQIEPVHQDFSLNHQAVLNSQDIFGEDQLASQLSPAERCKQHGPQALTHGLIAALSVSQTLQKLLQENPQQVLKFADQLEAMAKDWRAAANNITHEPSHKEHLSHIQNIEHLASFTRGAVNVKMNNVNHGLELPVALHIQNGKMSDAVNLHMHSKNTGEQTLADAARQSATILPFERQAA